MIHKTLNYLLLLTAVFGQSGSSVSGAITIPPSQCSSKCSSFSLATCAQKSVPTTSAQWTATCTSLASCICPILSANAACEACLVVNPDTVQASTYWGLLQTSCTQNTAAPQICQLFNVTISANIKGADNVTTTSTTPATSGNLSPPPAQSTKSTGGSERLQITAALAVALVASVFMV